MKEFKGWTPETIDNLTIDQLWHYSQAIYQYRQDIPSEDVTLEKIKDVIFGYFGLKDRKEPVTKDPLEKMKDSSFKTLQMKKGELQAYYRAGMPSPPEKWLMKYRKQNGNR